MSLKQRIIAAILLLLGLGGGVAYSQLGYAPGGYFTQRCGIGSTVGLAATPATTTRNALTPGTGTTTIPCLLGQDGVAFATLQVQFEGSSTGSYIDIAIEHSRDGQDWYSDITPLLKATTSLEATLNTPRTYRWQFASGTPYDGGTTDTLYREFQIDAPAPFVRAVITSPWLINEAGTATNTNALIWAEIRGKN